MDNWHYKPLDDERTERLARWLLPHARAKDSGVAICASMNAERLCEILSILTDKSPQWIEENFTLASAVKVLGEFAASGWRLPQVYVIPPLPERYV